MERLKELRKLRALSQQELAEAVDRGRELAKKAQEGQLVIRKQDNTFQEERTYGSDPHPPKG